MVELAWVEKDENGKFVIKRWQGTQVGQVFCIDQGVKGKKFLVVSSLDGAVLDNAGIFTTIAHALDPKATIPGILVS